MSSAVQRLNGRQSTTRPIAAKSRDNKRSRNRNTSLQCRHSRNVPWTRLVGLFAACKKQNGYIRENGRNLSVADEDKSTFAVTTNNRDNQAVHRQY